MPRRGSRRLVVDALEYRWRVLRTGASGCCGECDRTWDAGPLSLEVQIEAETGGGRLVVRYPCVQPDVLRCCRVGGAEGCPGPDRITPRRVSDLVRIARDAGWRPGESAPPLSLPPPSEQEHARRLHAEVEAAWTVLSTALRRRLPGLRVPRVVRELLDAGEHVVAVEFALDWVMDDGLTLQAEEERALGRAVRAVPETERIRSSLAALRRRRARDG